jgi:hypothetical protein
MAILELKTLVSIINKTPNNLILNHCKSYVGTDWKKYVVFSNQNYHRNVVYGNEKFDLYILSWKKGQTSGVHFHDKQCVFKVLRGSFVELRSTNKIYSNGDLYLREYNENFLKKSDAAKIVNSHHLMKGIDDYNVSLHVYLRM